MVLLRNTQTGFVTNDIGEWDTNAYKPDVWEEYNPTGTPTTVPATSEPTNGFQSLGERYTDDGWLLAGKNRWTGAFDQIIASGGGYTPDESFLSPYLSSNYGDLYFVSQKDRKPLVFQNGGLYYSDTPTPIQMARNNTAEGGTPTTAPTPTNTQTPTQQTNQPTTQSATQPTTSPIYGSLQDLANKGYQVSGGQVYSNGQVIGTYGGVESAQQAPVQTIQPGSLITGPSQLQGLSESDLARTTGANIYRRDLAKEQQAMSAYASQYGAPKTADDWLKFHDYVYEGKGVKTEQEATPPQSQNIVDSTVIQDIDTTEFESVADPEVINVSGITEPVAGVVAPGGTPQYSLTEGEKKEESYLAEIQSLYQELEDESSFRAEVEEEKGIPGYEATLNDLKTQLQALRNEAAGIPMALESAAAGKGITTTIMGRQQQELLRQNSIKALNVATQISAVQGLLVTAQNYADKAVEAEFGPIKAKLETSIRNLEILRESPQYSLEQKNQALAMQQILQAQQRAVAEQEMESKAVKAITIGLSQNVADARAINTISNAKTELEALQLAGRLATESGWQYVATPAERDKLRAQGYEIYENKALGRTYAKAPGEADATIQAYVNQIRSGGLKLSSVPADIRDEVVTALGNTPISGTGGTGGGGGGTTEVNEEQEGEGELSEWDYAREIIKLNPGKTTEEYRAALLENTNLSVSDINAILAEMEATAPKPETFSEDWFMDKISQAKKSDFSDNEIKEYIINNFDVDELFARAKAEGYAKWYTGKETDIGRYIDYLLSK